MISKSAIHAFLARSDTPGPSLAAFNTAFTCYYTLTSATEVTVALSLSYLKSRADLCHLITFMALVLSVPLLLIAATVVTPLGDWFYGELFGLGRQAVNEAQVCAAILMLSAPVLLARGTAFALLMLNRRTLVITRSTLIRLASIVPSLLVWPLVLDSAAAVGAAALVTCMAAETVYAWCYAWRDFLALSPGHSKPSLIALWCFSWPLALNNSAEMGTVFIINLFLGRLEQAELAIAAFGVVHGLASLLMAPLRNLAQSAQTLTASRADAAVMLRFSAQIVLFMMITGAIIFYTPLNEIILRTIMGLDDSLVSVCAPATLLVVGLAVGWGFASLFRGLLARARLTQALAITGLMRLTTAALIGTAVFWYAGVNGAVLGLAAWIASYAVEAAYTGSKLTQLGWYVEIR